LLWCLALLSMRQPPFNHACRTSPLFCGDVSSGHCVDGQGFSYHPGLSYREGMKGAPLPGWAWWFIELGSWLATDRQPGRVARAAISVPTRAYAALFAAMGIVSGSYRSGVLNVGERLRMLSRLKRGDPVRYCKGDEDLKVSYGEFSKIAKEPLFDLGDCVYLAERNGRVYGREVRQFHYIEPVGEEEGFSMDRPVCLSPDFVKEAMGIDPISQGFFSRLECVIIGNKTDLAEELELELQADGVSGKVQDVLRVHEHRPKDGYRSRTISFQADIRSELVGKPFGGVVMDGARSFLRWRGMARKHPWLVIIDRTNPTAGAARDAILGGLASSLEDANPPVGDPPSGIEAIFYWDRMR